MLPCKSAATPLLAELQLHNVFALPPAGVDLASLQVWMAEVQQRYSTNETAQVCRAGSSMRQLQAATTKVVGCWQDFFRAVVHAGALVDRVSAQLCTVRGVCCIAVPIVHAI